MYYVSKHPLIKDKLTRMRKIDTSSMIFRQNLNEITQLLVYEATKDMALDEIKINTPVVNDATGYKISMPITLVAILRAGLGMVDGAKLMLPSASIGHVGLYRDEESLVPVQYYFKMPAQTPESHVMVFDPMLATGGSAIAAIQLIKDLKPKKITFICLVAAPEGVKALQEAHPDVDIYIGGLDDHLNENGYIVPGLGDAGDRIFGTK
ncbi:uracil phosphoribosyltransferase [Ureaplasma ceti]|uniref:Uracil phosphoribosyltransferase n=1 Tax=Ureaplasma ceti TaxID=3119530 RepID=A0ABP9U7P4_9BACT